MTLTGILAIVNDNAGLISLVLSVIVLPYLKGALSTYKDNKALSNILGALTRGAELGAAALVANRLPTKAEAVNMAVAYARDSFPDALARLSPDTGKLEAMAQAQLEPILRAALAAEATRIALDRAAGLLPSPVGSGEGVG